MVVGRAFESTWLSGTWRPHRDFSTSAWGAPPAAWGAPPLPEGLPHCLRGSPTAWGAPLLPARLCLVVVFPEGWTADSKPVLGCCRPDYGTGLHRDPCPSPPTTSQKTGVEEWKWKAWKRRAVRPLCAPRQCPRAWPINSLMLWPSQSGILVCPKSHPWPFLSLYLGFKGMKETKNGLTWPKLREDSQ